jgi:hypothetical protein
VALPIISTAKSKAAEILLSIAPATFHLLPAIIPHDWKKATHLGFQGKFKKKHIKKQ